MKRRLSAFLLAGILFFAGGAESVTAGQMNDETENGIVQETVIEDFDSPQNVGGLKASIHLNVDKPETGEIYSEQRSAQSKRSKIYASEYDSYSTNYYYNQLNSDEKALWDQLDAMCLGYLTGTKSLAARKTYNSDGLSFNYYETEFVAYSNMSVEQAWQVADLFRYSNPQYYFLQLLVPAYADKNSGAMALTVFDAFGNGTARAAATQKMFGVVNNWMSQINGQPTEILKEKKAHDLICENVVYDPGYEDPGIGQNEYNQSAYSAFVEKVTVCAGYSQAMQMLMNRAGIDCGVVTSQAHEWNIVKINNTWYYVDCTWDDGDGKSGYEVIYKYFNRSKSQFLNFSDSNYIHHITENFWDPYLPNLDVYDSGATFSDYGTVNAAIGQLTAPVISLSGNWVTITAQPGTNIYYTLNGDDPKDSFTRSFRYKGSFQVSSEGIIRAVATASGFHDSSVAEAVVTKENLKPQVMTNPVLGSAFCLIGPEGEFESSNYLNRNGVMLIMGNSDCYNTLSFLDQLQGEISRIYQSGTEVLISFMDVGEPEELVKYRGKYPFMHFTCEDYDLLSGNLEAVGDTGMEYFPAIFVYNSSGQIVYYSSGYAEDVPAVADIACGVGTGNSIPAPVVEEEEEIKVKKVSISATSKEIAAGKKVTLTAEVLPKNADNKKLSWKSSNTKYATVNSRGVVTTKKAGAGKTVKITAKATDGSGVSSSIKLKLMKNAVTGIKVKNAPKTLAAGKSVTLRTTVKTNGKKVNKKVVWKTSNAKYATVNSKGKVTAKKAGINKTVTITVTSTDGTNKKATVKIKIKKK